MKGKVRWLPLLILLVLGLSGACSERRTPTNPVLEPTSNARLSASSGGILSCTVPPDYAILRIGTSPSCGQYVGSFGQIFLIAIPGPSATVCGGAPSGYVVVAVIPQMGACNPRPGGFNQGQTIKLPGYEEWVCSGSLPGNYQIIGSGTSSACGPTNLGNNASRVRWVRSNGTKVPTGQIDGIASDGTVSGWVCQPDHPALNTEVQLYAGAAWPSGKQFASFRSNVAAEVALANRCNGRGTYRFRYKLTLADLGKLTPGTYKVYAHGVDIDGGGRTQLGQPLTFVRRR